MGGSFLLSRRTEHAENDLSGDSGRHQGTATQRIFRWLAQSNPPTPDTLYQILKRAYAFVLALNEKGEVVGFIHAISDGILTASIPLLEVRPAYKGQGIGSELVRLLLSQLEGL